MAREVGKSDGTKFLASLLYLPLVPASRAEHCSCQWQETAVNKGVKHVLDYAETLTASVDFNGPNPQKEWGASYLPAPRTYKLLTTDQG